MKRSIDVRSHTEGDALVRVMDIPVLKSAQTITGLLLEHDEEIRAVVLQLVQASLRLASNGHDPRHHTVAIVDVTERFEAGSSGE